MSTCPLVSTTNLAMTTPPIPAARNWSGYRGATFPAICVNGCETANATIESGAALAVCLAAGATIRSGDGVMHAANTAATAKAPSTAAVIRGADDGLRVIALILRSRSDVDSVRVAAP